ncbi:MAG: hypothetical protein MUO78_07620 [candidate division Zixibacteria bacterium]|nr:hypothetical protein [candidate division Zixibacteria bacterium]
MLKRFNKIFGIQESDAEEKRRFVQRINQTIFKEIEDDHSYEKIFRTVCYKLGTNADDRISSANQVHSSVGLIIPSLRSLTGDDFQRTLKVLVLLYEYFDNNNEWLKYMSDLIKIAFSNATIDLGIKWKKGMFYQSGAKELDEKLVEDSLDWLENYPNEKGNFLKAIENHTSKKYDDVVIDCYLVIEGLARKVLKNKKTLENNREELLRKIGLSQEWKAFLNNYINYANEIKRHASDKRRSINPSEVEAYLYFTGLLVRF